MAIANVVAFVSLRGTDRANIDYRRALDAPSVAQSRISNTGREKPEAAVFEQSYSSMPIPISVLEHTSESYQSASGGLTSEALELLGIRTELFDEVNSQIEDCLTTMVEEELRHSRFDDLRMEIVIPQVSFPRESLVRALSRTLDSEQAETVAGLIALSRWVVDSSCKRRSISVVNDELMKFSGTGHGGATFSVDDWRFERYSSILDQFSDRYLKQDKDQ